MSNLPQTLLGRYQYTALDKLSACTLGAQPSSQRFYLGERLSTEIQGAVQHSIMQHEDQLLAQQQRQAGTLHTHLLATDQQRSVLTLLDASRPQHLAYSPYGHRTSENGLLSLLGFNGERPDPVTGHYLLGNGYRAFNPVLMRFNSPDSWSPFGKGGLNAYGYCVGDPVNRSDPTGHITWHSLMMKHFPKAVSAANSGRALFKNSMGAFAPFENMPDVMSSIIGNLKAPDIASLGATSSKMYTVVNQAKKLIPRLLKQPTLENNKQAIETAWDIATGNMPGTTPNQLKEIGIDTPFRIPHQVDPDGFSSVAELERRYQLYEKAMAVQRKIRERL
jgi:RHS repeat-associated protein